MTIRRSRKLTLQRYERDYSFLLLLIPVPAPIERLFVCKELELDIR
jgi:hypothetical protein